MSCKTTTYLEVFQFVRKAITLFGILWLLLREPLLLLRIVHMGRRAGDHLAAGLKVRLAEY